MTTAVMQRLNGKLTGIDLRLRTSEQVSNEVHVRYDKADQATENSKASIKQTLEATMSRD